jgi:hypothetical protein
VRDRYLCQSRRVSSPCQQTKYGDRQLWGRSTAAAMGHKRRPRSQPPFGWNENSWPPQYQQYSCSNNADWSNFYYTPPAYQQQGTLDEYVRRLPGCVEDTAAVLGQSIQLPLGPLLFARRAAATTALSSSTARAGSRLLPLLRPLLLLRQLQPGLGNRSRSGKTTINFVGL